MAEHDPGEDAMTPDRRAAASPRHAPEHASRPIDENALPQRPATPAWAAPVMEMLKIALVAALIALGFRSLAYEPFNIPSSSMLPGLLVGDYLVVSKFAYGYSRFSFPLGALPIHGRVLERPVARGDVVVFKWPGDNRTDYIKRVIGLPGDIIQLRDGVVQLNGVTLTRTRIEDFILPVSANTDCRTFSAFRDRGADGQWVCRYPQYRETLPGGRSYPVLDLVPRGRNDNTPTFVVPEGHYFMMGDNRDDSQDSRVSISAMPPGVGFVPAANIVGRAERLVFSTAGGASLFTPWRWPSAVRWQRLFAPVR